MSYMRSSHNTAVEAFEIPCWMEQSALPQQQNQYPAYEIRSELEE